MNTSDNREESRTGNWKRLKNIFSSIPQTTQDVVALVDAATENEVIDKDAKRIIEGALEVSEMQARDIMIPRPQVVVLKATDSLQENLDKIIESGHSRYPVIGESMDDVQGLLLSKDLLPLMSQINQELEDKLNSEKSEAQDEKDSAVAASDSTNSAASNFDLISLLRPPVFVPESKRLNVLLKQFREDRNHMALVIDEYGSLAGLVTIEDVLEEIVGDIEDEHDDIGEKHIRKISDNLYMVNALMPIEDFNAQFHRQLEDDEFDTMGGFVTNLLGHLPKRGEQVSFEDCTFHVMQADSRRVRMLRMTFDRQDTEESEPGS